MLAFFVQGGEANIQSKNLKQPKQKLKTAKATAIVVRSLAFTHKCIRAQIIFFILQAFFPAIMELE